ncbi:hypothetical protein BH18THE2_BH18THE2_18230 [soil metagenome]
MLSDKILSLSKPKPSAAEALFMLKVLIAGNIPTFGSARSDSIIITATV